jgi:hypothetical protein
MFEDEDELIAAVCDEEERPKIPADCPPALRELIESCWHPDSEKRYDSHHVHLHVTLRM